MQLLTIEPTPTPTATGSATESATPTETSAATPSTTPEPTSTEVPATGSLDTATFVDTLAGVTDHLVLLIWIGGIILFLLAFLAVMAVRR